MSGRGARGAVGRTVVALALGLGLMAVGRSSRGEERPVHVARACDAAARARLLAPPSGDDDVAALTCSVRLAPGEAILRRVLLEGAAASGVTLDCDGGTIGAPSPRPPFWRFALEIRSRPLPPGPDGAPRWERPSGVTVRGCTIYGSTRIWGMGLNGQGEAVKASSHALGHTERAQAAAPTRVAITDSNLVALGSIPLYVAPGATAVSLLRSRVSGTSSSVAVYLDAESGRNAIEGNTFDVETGRELVAVDGSAFNRIVDNAFVLRNRGGIHLYRNCGEGGTVRHQTPSDNVITGNTFRRTGWLPVSSIVVGSRGGLGLFCAEDDGYPFGSSADDGDHAERNVVEGNRDE